VYYIGAIADAADAQIETNESNNALAGAAITVGRVVDLMMTGVSTASTYVAAASSFVVTDTEKNNGTTGMTASGNRVDFYLSADNVITCG